MGHGSELGELVDILRSLRSAQQENLSTLGAVGTNGYSEFSEMQESSLVHISEFVESFAKVESHSEYANDSIPAGYTYLAQFLTHDLTFSAGRLFSKTPSTALEMRTTSMDMDCLYSGGPMISPHLYQIEGFGHNNQTTRSKLRIGRTRGDTGQSLESTENDIPRSCLNDESTNFSCPSKMGIHPKGHDAPLLAAPYTEPVVADIRNTDNLILQQIVVLFIRLHNKVLNVFPRVSLDTNIHFHSCRKICQLLYRSVIVNDLLFRLIDPDVYTHFFGDGYCTYTLANPATPPVKISQLSDVFRSAAMRLGHAMIQPRYDFNAFFDIDDENGGATLQKLLDFAAFSNNGGIKIPITNDWVIDWGLFFPQLANYDGDKSRIFDKFASSKYSRSKLITQSYADGLFNGAFNRDPITREKWTGGLIFADLLRGLKDKLPSASEFCGKVQECSDLAGLKDFEVELSDELSNGNIFLYFLREAETMQSGRRFGPLASIVVAAQIQQSLTELELTGPEYDFVAHLTDDGRFWMPQLVDWVTGGTQNFINPNTV